MEYLTQERVWCAVGFFVADLLQMLPPLFHGLLVVHVLGEARLQCTCLAVGIWERLLPQTHILVHFL